MNSWRLLNRSNTGNILLRLVLVLSLLFAIAHVSQHALIDEEASHLQSDCQTCRLAHFQGATPSAVLMVTPLFVCLGTLLAFAIPLSSCLRVYSWNARAPPSL